MNTRKPKYYNAIVYVMGRDPICISGIVRDRNPLWAEEAIERELIAADVRFDDCHAVDIFPVQS